jgi:hypothetical protein
MNRARQATEPLDMFFPARGHSVPMLRVPTFAVLDRPVEHKVRCAARNQFFQSSSSFLWVLV